MNMLKSISNCAALAAAVLLAGCGGGGTTTPGHSQQAGDISTGGGSATPVTADFVKLAQQEPCGDIKNRLYLIDGKEVFWDRAGSCPDNAYVQRLYGANPQTVLCEMTDTIGGPKTFCANESMRALFELLQRGADVPGLGLDASHKVELITFLPKSGTALPFHTLVMDGHTGVTQQRDVVVRDQAAFDKLWAEHVSDRTPTPAAPVVDFSTKMVVGVFEGNVATCANMGIVGVRSQDGKMVVDIERRAPDPSIACPAVILTPMQLVVVDRNDAPAEFVRHDVQLLPAVVVDGTNLSGVHDRRDVVIKEKAAWAALWAEHVSQMRVVSDTGTPVKDTRPVPDIDFNTQMVVGVFLGMGGNGCSSTSIASLSTDGKTITVRHSDTVPGIGIMCAMYVPSPAQLVAVPRSDLPVKFVGEIRTLNP
jgi:hypothetical protein